MFCSVWSERWRGDEGGKTDLTGGEWMIAGGDVMRQREKETAQETAVHVVGPAAAAFSRTRTAEMKNTATLVLLLLLVGCATSRPTKYDQRQDGDWNVHAHLENIVIVYVSKDSGLGINLLDLASKKAASAKHHHAQGKDADGGGATGVIIADSPGAVHLEFKAADVDKEAEDPSEKTAGTTSPTDLFPDKESPEKENVSKESTTSSEEQSTEYNPKEKSPEENGPKDSEEENSSEKSSEESSSSEASGEKEESGKKPEGARVLDRADDKSIAKLKQILADGVEPCLRVSSQGHCLPVSTPAKKRLERRQRQRLIDILSSGVSAAI